MKKTKEKAIIDIANMPEFRSLANDLEQCDHKEYATNTGSVIPALPIHPELEILIDNFLLNHLQNIGLIAYNIPDNISIIHPNPKYPEINYDSDSYSSYSNLDDDNSESEEDRIETWLSKVELPSKARAIYFANMNNVKLKNKVHSSYSKPKKKHNK